METHIQLSPFYFGILTCLLYAVIKVILITFMGEVATSI